MCTAGIKQAIGGGLKNPKKIKPFVPQYKNKPKSGQIESHYVN